MTKWTQLPSIENLADEVFIAAEYHQGKGFVSDGLGSCKTTDELFSAVRGHLKNSEIAVKRIRAFLKKYGQE